MSFYHYKESSDLLLEPNINNWLPENHLAKFIVRIVDELDLSNIYQLYGGKGKQAYHPKMMTALLIYSYAVGVFSSRQIEECLTNRIDFMYISLLKTPDHSTISKFRLKACYYIKDIFLQILLKAHELNFLELGTICLDGTKIKANASRHHAYSYAKGSEIYNQLSKEIEELFVYADSQEAINKHNNITLNLNNEICRRISKCQTIAKALDEIKKHEEDKYIEACNQYNEKINNRQQQFLLTGKKPKGKEPNMPEPFIKPSSQINITDPDSRIMPSNNKGFIQAYNAQASVEPESMLIVGQHVTQCTNDKKEIVPAVNEINQLPEILGKVDTAVADAGFFSKDNIEYCENNGIEPYIAAGRNSHHPGVFDRFQEPNEPPANADYKTIMQYKLKTTAGKSIYKLRKQVVEPVFGVIKTIMKFSSFSFRGINKVKNEWTLICSAYNLKKMHKLQCSKQTC